MVAVRGDKYNYTTCAQQTFIAKGKRMNRITWVFLAWSALLVGNAQAVIDMPQREHVQTFVWILEAVTFVTIAAIFWFVWRISMRDKANRKSNTEN
jgi:uncharacterized membrane protein YesL